MNRESAIRLAVSFIPDANRPQAINGPRWGLAEKELNLLDINGDAQLSQMELADAFIRGQVVQPDKTQQLTFFKERPPQRPETRFGGAQTLGVSKPEQVMVVDSAAADINLGERNLDNMTESVKTPDQVATLLGSINYDTERGKPLGGDGPLGAQTPEDTLNGFSGVCRDIHQLGAYLLQQNGYNALQVGYVANRTSHSVLAYQEPGKGYGVIEYGRVYTPADLETLLGRPALSPQEAISALRPEAKVIFGWTPPEKGQNGYVENIYYTMGHRLYQETLKLKHEDSLEIDNVRGLQLEKTLGEHWSIKINQQLESPGDPTGKHASSIAAGYQWGNFDNWGRVSLGVQHRPNEGKHVVGPNTWEKNPTTLIGVSVEGKVTPFKHRFNDRVSTSTTIYGNLSGAAVAINDKKKSDNGKRVSEGIGYDNDIITGLPQANIRVSQNLDADLGKGFKIQNEAFMDTDLYLGIASWSMGGKILPANIGVSSTLQYEKGPVKAYVGGQYLFHQVNNLEATGAIAGVKYDTGRLSLAADSRVFGSPEGTRVVTGQQVGVKITKDVDIHLRAQQENIFNKEIGHYTNAGGMSFGGGVSVRF